MRKRNIIILGSVIFIIMIGITGCSAVKTTSDPTPEQVYSDDNNVDMFVYDQDLFKVREETVKRPFVSDAFRETVINSGLTGFSFELVWECED